MDLPFDRSRLESRMEAEGIDLVLATSPHNIQYLLGGYRPHFFAEMQAIGLSRQQGLVGYPAGLPEFAFYLGNVVEAGDQSIQPLWTRHVENRFWKTRDVGVAAAALVRGLGLEQGRVGVEYSFLPADTYVALVDALPEARLVDATALLEHLRAVKRPQELALMSQASEAIVDSFLAVLAQAHAGVTTAKLAQAVAREEVSRGLHFDYCLAAAGPSMVRTPSAARWELGRPLSVDSGGSKGGYIGDIARMAVLGPPSARLVELLEQVEEIQMAARGPIRPGSTGEEIYAAAAHSLAGCPDRGSVEFVAHGLGLVSHEAPRLTETGPVPYPADHARLPLEPGMVLSIETTVRDPEVGLVKLEDTLAVTRAGFDAYGDRARGWQIVS